MSQKEWVRGGSHGILKEEVVARCFLLDILDGVKLVDAWAEIVRVTTERYAQQFKKPIHALQERLWAVTVHMHQIDNCCPL